MQKNRTIGLFLIAFGFIMILGYYRIIHFDIWDLWPLLLMYLGVKAERDYFNGYGGSGKLMTGAVLITYSLYFLADNFISSRISNLLWPMLILGPALGFLQKAYFGHNRRKNKRVGTIMLLISGIFFINELVNLRYDLFLYVALVMVGFFMLRKDKYDDGDDDDSNERY